MNLVVAEKEMVADNTVRVRMTHPDGESLQTYAPGSHVELSFAGMVRRYSLTSPIDEASYREICVLRTDPSGGGSAFIHNELEVGDTIDVSDPQNAFPLSTEAKHSVFIAGGIGITPFVSMMTALAIAEKNFELHYAARDASRFLPLPQHLSQGSRYTDHDGRPGLDVGKLLDRLDREAHLYVCGPRALIETVRLGAAEREWAASHIHFESFGASPKPTDEAALVQLTHSNMSVAVPVGQSILDALLEVGVWAPFECKRGECGSCYTPVASGCVDHRDVCLTPDQREHGMCTCVSWPKSKSITLEI